MQKGSDLHRFKFPFLLGIKHLCVVGGTILSLEFVCVLTFIDRTR